MAYTNTSKRLLILPLHQRCEEWLGGGVRGYGNGSCVSAAPFWSWFHSGTQPKTLHDLGRAGILKCLPVNEAWCVQGSGCVSSGCGKVRKQKPENSSHQANINIHREGLQPRGDQLGCCRVYSYVPWDLNKNKKSYAITTFIKIHFMG